MNQVKATLPVLIHSLMKADVYDHPVDEMQLIETHISWVILTGAYAYKIKKPLNLGFLDFSSLDKRGYYCQEELRLNRRLAPTIYLSVVAIKGQLDKPVLNGNGEVIEYAVKMTQFPQEVQLDRMLARGEFYPQQLDELSSLIAHFHQHIEVADETSDWGDLQHIILPVKENFTQILEAGLDEHNRLTLMEISDWSKSCFDSLSSEFIQRKHDGFIRECHGDLHLRNLAWYQEHPIAFDCLEFNANLRWIDVISEVAFLIMDLQDREEHHLAQRFLNAYLQTTGDYAGLAVLPFYLVYRALVRAKVDAIRLHQNGVSSQDQSLAEVEFRGYMNLAKRYTQKVKPQLIITHGMSASGKSTLTQPILEQLGAIRIQSDVERKRLFGLMESESIQVGINQGIYTTEANQQTYKRLYELAEIIIDAGYSVIIDAVFLQVEQRRAFEKLAVTKSVSYRILDFVAQEKTLRERIIKRERGISDADLLVLEHQIKVWRPLEEDETDYCILVDTDIEVDIDSVINKIMDV